MIDKSWEKEFRERLTEHFDELRWLYFELYHSDEQAFDYFLSMLHRYLMQNGQFLYELSVFCVYQVRFYCTITL